MVKKYSLICGIILVLTTFAAAQHRGDNLAFQGLPLSNGNGVKASALGNAYTSQSGDLNALYHNPAGLADITRLQVSISANHYANQWRENQVYRPNRMFWTMAYYLEGLYIPDAKNNGIWDYVLAQDTSYHVAPPVTGLEPFSEQAADWQKKTSDMRVLNLGIAVPFKQMGVRWVASAAYSSDALLDFDRNDTYLDPHIGYDAYGVVPRVVTDTVRFSWSRFTRDREGDVKNLTAALSMQVGSRLNIGFTMNRMRGHAMDAQSLDRMGYFDIAKDNRFRFSYDTLDVALSGESEFSVTHFKMGAIYRLDRLNLGLAIRAPFTITRDWTCVTKVSNSMSAATTNASGKETHKHPATFSFGASVTPIDPFRFLLDYEFTDYSQSKIEPVDSTAAAHHLPDLSELRCGIEFTPLHFLSLLAGYRYTTSNFVPDGAAIKDLGPASTTYSIGASLKLFSLGRLDIAYQMQRLKYYDSYFSNTNYVHEARNNVLVGYTHIF